MTEVAPIFNFNLNFEFEFLNLLSTRHQPSALPQNTSSSVFRILLQNPPRNYFFEYTTEYSVGTQHHCLNTDMMPLVVQTLSRSSKAAVRGKLSQFRMGNSVKSSSKAASGQQTLFDFDVDSSSSASQQVKLASYK